MRVLATSVDAIRYFDFLISACYIRDNFGFMPYIWKNDLALLVAIIPNCEVVNCVVFPPKDGEIFRIISNATKGSRMGNFYARMKQRRQKLVLKRSV